MPILGRLIYGLFRIFYRANLAMFGQAWAIRLTAITILAGLYIACVATMAVMIVPWFLALLGTQFGMLLGLLFPPVAGTCVAALGVFWSCILLNRYSSKLIKLAMGATGGGGGLVTT